MKIWTEAAREGFSAGALSFEGNLFSDVFQRLLNSGTLSLKVMQALQQSLQAASQGEGNEETLLQLFDQISQSYQEWYQQEVGKYLSAPQLGPFREIWQEMLGAVNTYQRLLGVVGDFGLKFSLPYKKSLEIFFKEIKNGDPSHTPFENLQDIVNRLVTILEKTYDDYLKSAEGQKSVIGMVEAYLEHKEKMDAVLSQAYKALSLPTKKEMEDVYERLHRLRKTSRRQERLIQEQAEHLKRLEQKILEIETLSASSSKGKGKAPRSSGKKTTTPMLNKSRD